MAGKLKNDIKGQRFGSLEVVEYIGRGKWRCKCDCGNEVKEIGVRESNEFLELYHLQGKSSSSIRLGLYYG